MKFYQDWSSKHVADPDIDPIQNLSIKSSRSNNNDQQNSEIESAISNDNDDLIQPPYHHYRQYRFVST